LERFEQEWSGAALAIEDIKDAGEPDYKKNRNKEVKETIFKSLIAGSIVVLIVLLTCLVWGNDISLSLLPKTLLFLSNAAGCFISYLLVRQEKRLTDALSEKFCKAGKHIDCKQVTNSKYSSFWGIVSLAELGAAFFGSMLLWIAIAPLSAGWVTPLWWFSLLILPFTLWSLVTQAFVIRKWCLFCCTVVILLWANAAILLIFFPLPVPIAMPEAALLALIFVTTMVAVIETGKTIGSKDRLYAQQRETAKIKYNIATIQSQLSGEVYIMTNTGFVFGNPGSTCETGLYVSAFCHHCKEAVKE
jgi:uncharacterized membrane protein